MNNRTILKPQTCYDSEQAGGVSKLLPLGADIRLNVTIYILTFPFFGIVTSGSTLLTNAKYHCQD